MIFFASARQEAWALVVYRDDGSEPQCWISPDREQLEDLAVARGYEDYNLIRAQDELPTLTGTDADRALIHLRRLVGLFWPGVGRGELIEPYLQHLAKKGIETVGQLRCLTDEDLVGRLGWQGQEDAHLRAETLRDAIEGCVAETLCREQRDVA